LIESFRAGDREAFEQLHQTYSPSVFRFVFYMTGDRRHANEITQDAFVWLLRHPASFDPDRGNLGALLRGVAVQLLRRERRNLLRWLPLREAAAEAPAFESADIAALRRAIGRLPQRYREALVLCDLEGRSYEEAAASIGCAIGTVRSRLHRARELLAR